ASAKYWAAHASTSTVLYRLIGCPFAPVPGSSWAGTGHSLNVRSETRSRFAASSGVSHAKGPACGTKGAGWAFRWLRARGFWRKSGMTLVYQPVRREGKRRFPGHVCCGVIGQLHRLFLVSQYHHGFKTSSSRSSSDYYDAEVLVRIRA